MTGENILLEVRRLKIYFPVRKGIFMRTVGHVKAVDDIDLFVKEGETLGLVGESGCGKTTTGRAILRLIEPTEGEILVRSKKLSDTGESYKVDIVTASPKLLKALRRDLQIIFQDPYSSLDPRMTVAEIVGEPLQVHGIAQGSEKEDRIEKLLATVGLNPEQMKRYPHQFSGGQRQRIGIARALAVEPELIICDEPISALDVSIQAQVVNMLEDLQDEMGLTYLFIAHDLSMVKHISDRIGVMYLGQLAEVCESNELYKNPLHPYTQALLSAIPIPDPHKTRRHKRIVLQGDVASPINPKDNCRFAGRCTKCRDICREQAPQMREVSPGHFVACHFVEEG
ncbi:MAG: oligopeptide/dipeptide ABC transporter ATP-binding protein [Bacillota bacterium]